MAEEILKSLLKEYAQKKMKAELDLEKRKENLYNKFDNKLYQKLKKSNKIHKLSYKKKNVTSPDTFYDVILRRNEE